MNKVADQEYDVARLLEESALDLHLPVRGWDVTPVQADGSDRRFFRACQGELHFIILISPRREGAVIDENDSYFRIGQHLYKSSLPVPRTLWADVSRGWFLMQDVGDEHLQKLVLHDPSNLPSLYGRAVRLLANFHRVAPVGFEPDFCFDSVLYDAPFIMERELEYFRKAFLIGLVGLDASGEDLQPDFESLADIAGAIDFSTVMHRDFQSRNIMVHQEELWILDFQGMRFGPASYDLASLLLDPYVMLSGSLQVELAELYWSEAKEVFKGSREHFLREYVAARLCRNLQVLGAYGFLGKVKGKKQFLRYIPGAMKHLREWLHGPCRNRYPRLEKWVNLAGSVLDNDGRGLLKDETFT